MNPLNIILPVVILLIIGGALAYIIQSKKRGKACIGCPYAGECGKHGATCSCHTVPAEDVSEKENSKE